MGSLEPRAFPKSSARGVTMVSIIGADDLLGAEVVARDDTRIGELQDMMLDLRVGHVAYGIVTLDRPPEWSERLVVVPWNVMHINGNGDLRVNAPRDRVERAPSMQPELLPTLLDHE